MNLINKPNHWGCILSTSLLRKYSGNSAKKLKNDAGNLQIKREKAKLLKRFNKENKLLFGSLVETLPQKRKREIDEPINATFVCTPDIDDKSSEALWWKKSLETNVKPSSAPWVHKGDKVNKSRDQSDITKDENISWRNEHVSTPVMSEKIVVNNVDNYSVFHKSSLRLPQIIVKNLSVFPMENKQKHSLSLASNSSSILHIPMKEDDGLRTKYKEYPSVSRILNATLSDASQAALQKWKENLIAELGLEGFQKYQRALLEHGRMFHRTVQEFLSGELIDDIQIDSAVEGCWHSIQATMKEIGAVKVLESHVVHEELLYHGIIDCIAEYKGKMLLIEWKKSNKQKSTLWNTYDAPLQVAAYVGALNFDTSYDLKVDGGLVVVAYSDGTPAHVHPLNKSQCEKYWHMWLKRLQLYWDLLDKQDAGNVPNAVTL